MTPNIKMSLETSDTSLDDPVTEEYQSHRDHHRAAAAHFVAAAKHHLVAATADDEGKPEAANRHAYLAYRHRLHGVQYAEIAAMHSEKLKTALERFV
jgi:hypothetical protein